MFKNSSSARPLSAALLVSKGSARPAPAFGQKPQAGQAGTLFGAKPTSLDPATLAEKQPAGKKAAFTFRMDERQHFRLRLLSAHQNRSSQKILEEALDAYLDANAPQTSGLACPCFGEGEN